jgi:hypothetical protein
MSLINEKDAACFRWLMVNAVYMRKADANGPECPILHLMTDLWNSQPDVSAQERLVKHIEEQIEKGISRTDQAIRSIRSDA